MSACVLCRTFCELTLTLHTCSGAGHKLMSALCPLFFSQGAERKIRDEERKLFRKKSKGLSRIKNIARLSLKIRYGPYGSRQANSPVANMK